MEGSHRFSRGLFPTTVLFLLFLSSIVVEGRDIPKHRTPPTMVKEEKEVLRSEIGSRPPRCEQRCSSCGHCEAIQVPANPQVKSSYGFSHIAYARGDYVSSYKPMNWKCKCGASIFNP
ncbi:hypothetical protein Nepgr_016548 [Nepenthes gracilis]|uniref:Epidermal patterning factor-like protein n=1 Tax=Nepenthes gracilis TaxID=150966 RepID=A0AAD3SPE7_NEPGR|nr:hypothetical protein Nepgr_016548 [Nepenthes gracilis]